LGGIASEIVLASASFLAYVERMDRKQLAQCCRMARRVRRLSLREVAEKTGIGIGSLSEIERGKRNLSFDTAAKLLSFYGMELGARLKSSQPKKEAVEGWLP
jgi:transcriptional regulator with XRE-family HTH domain